jgi:hypothetical protein
MHRRETACEYVECIHFDQDREDFLAVMKTVMDFRVP